MDFKITSTKGTPVQAFALTEVLMAVGLAGLFFLIICGFSMFCSRSFAALYNYVDLDDVNRVAIDQLTRDVRQANRVSYYGTNGMALTLEATDNNGLTNSISYVYSPNTRTLTRSLGLATGLSDTTTLLKECDRLEFRLGQRNTDVGGYYVFPPQTADINVAKVINVSWVCSRSLFGRKENTESVQTARIVIRKQGS